jgi:hypothetical protein
MVEEALSEDVEKRFSRKTLRRGSRGKRRNRGRKVYVLG